jgi:hypothetical protein
MLTTYSRWQLKEHTQKMKGTRFAKTLRTLIEKVKKQSIKINTFIILIILFIIAG